MVINTITFLSYKYTVVADLLWVNTSQEKASADTEVQPQMCGLCVTLQFVWLEVKQHQTCDFAVDQINII